MMKLNTETDYLRFQCKDIVSRDAVPDTTIDSDSSDGSYHGDDPSDNVPKEYQILLFGTDEQGQSVALQITDFKPYFYVRLPDALKGNKTAYQNLERWLFNGVPEKEHMRVNIKMEEHQTLMDYTGGNKGVFMKIIVPTLLQWRELKDRFMDKSSIPKTYETASLFGAGAISILAKVAKTPTNDIHDVTADGKLVALKIYEANIDPVLRFFHERDLSPAGWVQVPPIRWDYASSMDASVKVFATAAWQDVQPATDSTLAPFLVGSWDIECNSSHGDFPMAVKTWKKPIRELYEAAVSYTHLTLPTILRV